MTRNHCLGTIVAGMITAAAAMPASAVTGVYAQAGASGAAVQSYSLAVSYQTATGLFVSSAGPLNGTTASYSPTAASPGLNAISLAAGVSGSRATGSSTASADLAAGTVRTTANSDTFGASGTAIAELMDDLTFAVAGGGSRQITVTSHLDGAIGSFGTVFSRSGLNYLLNFGASDFSYLSEGSPGGFTFSTSGALTPAPAGWDSYAFSNVTETGFDFTGKLTIADGELRSIRQRLYLNCQEGVDCDFANTGRIGLVLPDGVRFTSASGVFLQSTGPGPGPGPIPEPASWAMLVAGFGLMGAALRRARPDGARRAA